MKRESALLVVHEGHRSASVDVPAAQCLAFMREWPGQTGLAPLVVATDANRAAP